MPRSINQVAGAIFMFIVSKSMKGADKLKIKDLKFEIDELKSVSRLYFYYFRDTFSLFKEQ